MLVLGLDSATHIGLVAWSMDSNDFISKAIEVNETGFGRLRSIRDEFSRTLDIWGNPDFAVIERLAFVRNIDSFIRVVEVVTILKEELYSRKIPWVDVSPTLLKKWFTGKGNATKDEMLAVSTKVWGFNNSNTDIIDGYALARMGIMGLEELRKYTSPKLKKGKKKKNVS